MPAPPPWSARCQPANQPLGKLGAERYAWLRDALVRITALLEDPEAGPLPEGPTV